MTTIVYDHELKQIAYDSRVMRAGIILTDEANKCCEHSDGCTYFHAGSVSDFQEFLKANRTPGIINRGAEACSVMMVRNGEVYECGFDEEDGYWELLASYSFALGSGTPFALAALDCGCTAEQAIEAAKLRDPNTGGTVRVHRIQDAED